MVGFDLFTVPLEILKLIQRRYLHRFRAVEFTFKIVVNSQANMYKSYIKSIGFIFSDYQKTTYTEVMKNHHHLFIQLFMIGQHLVSDC